MLYLHITKEKENMKREENITLPYDYAVYMEHFKWGKEIPFIKFNPKWEIQITPPFAGAVVRFRVKYKNADVSIYLDCYDALGYVGEPYWEVYPDTTGDCFRCLMNETDLLLKAIQESIDEQLT